MIAIVGVGAVGGACAAPLCHARDDVVLCLRTPFRELSVRGFSVQKVERPRVVSFPDGLGSADWVLLATKAHQVRGAAPWMDALVGPHTRVAVLQNGVDHAERLRGMVPIERVLPVVVDCPASVTAPGQIQARRAPRLVVPYGRDGTDFAALFDGTMVKVELTNHFVTALWHKLCINVTGGAIAALAGVALPHVRHPNLAALAYGLARECAAVGRAEGADLSDAEADQIAHEASHAKAGGTPSTLTDRLSGRPLEVEARNGAVARIGAVHGIETPFNQRAAELLSNCHFRTGNLLVKM